MNDRSEATRGLRRGSSPTSSRRLPRRQFVRKLGRLVGGAALVTGALAVSRSILNNRNEPEAGTRADLGLLRPPGAPSEPEFLARCIRCTECRDVCRADAIRMFTAGSGELSGTPYILPVESACNLCLECGDACPSAALSPLESIEAVNMGTAVVDERLCVSHNGTGVCGACHTICPLKNRAIVQNYRNAPEVNAELCVGCGLCEEACIVADRKAIRVVTERHRSVGAS